MLCRRKLQPGYQFTRFMGFGDHPKVKISTDGFNGYYILSKGGPTVVNIGDYIVRIKSGCYNVFSPTAFARYFEIIAED